MTGLLTLVAAAAVLFVVAVRSAHPPVQPLPGVDGYLERWRSLHGDVDPRASRLLRTWLRLAFTVARPLAHRGVQPDVLTLMTLWLAAAAAVAAATGDGWVFVAAAAVVASGLVDALDGAVAVLTDRASAFGHVLDSVVDRVSDALFLAAVWAAGAPAWLAVFTAAVSWLLEYLRARAAVAGAGPVGAVTVGEHANRVLFCAAGLFCAGVFASHAGLVLTVWTGGLTVLSVVGFVQLLRAVRRQLSGSDV